MIYESKFDNNVLKNIWNLYLNNKTEFDYTTLYIHFPFCMKKCSYCMQHTIATDVTEEIIAKSISYLEDQFVFANSIFKNEPIKAIYFGGGCQTFLPPREMKKMFDIVDKYWNIEKSYENEISYEIHPYQMDDEKIEVLNNSFVNRVSIGIQSFDEKVCNAINRVYCSPEKFFHIYDNLNMKNKNVDLIYGLHEQSDESYLNDVKMLVKHGVQSISLHGYVNTPNNHFNRPINDQNEFNKRFFSLLKEISIIDPSYEMMGGESESNILVKKDTLKFKHIYDHIEDFNNTLGFNMFPINLDGFVNAISTLFPIDLIYYHNDSKITMKSIKDGMGDNNTMKILEKRELKLNNKDKHLKC